MSRKFAVKPSAAAVALALSGAAQAQVAQTLPEVQVTAPAGGYQAELSSSPKHTAPLLDTPQTVNVITAQVLDEQGIVSLRDALRNVTGISIQAGEGNPPSGDQLKIRGFSARDNILVNGARDVGNYFRDPFNIERIEVTKGPASSYAGRSATGGSIDLVTKTPSLRAQREVELGVGTDAYRRLTADLNQPIDGLQGAAFRLNVMSHDADQPRRDHVENKRTGIAASLALGLGTPTRMLFSYYHTRQDNLPDSGLPNARNFSLAGSGFEGKVAPVRYSNFYGHDTDYQDLVADQAEFRIEHDFSRGVSLRNQLRYARAHNDSIFSSPRFVGSPTTLDAATQVVANQKPRDQEDTLLINQTDLTWRFATGGLRHTLVTGLEISREESENRRRLDANGPATSLFDPVLRAAAPIPYNGTRAQLETDVTAVYAFDTIEFGPRWQASAGLRQDRVKTTVRGIDDSGTLPGYATNLSTTDNETSGSLGLVYKPVRHASVYAGYGTSFETSGRADIVQLAGGNNNPPVSAANFNVAPEKSRGFELGTKWNLLGERLALNAAVFRVEKTNARTPGVNPGDPAVVLEGEQRVDGFEVSATGQLARNWSLLAGYTYLDGKVVTSNRSFEIGQRLDNAPRHTASLWTTYQLTPALTLGGGAQYVDERTSNVRESATANFVITADDYVVLDAFAAYRLSKNSELRLNIYNVADEQYLFELSSGQSVPGTGRSAVLSARLEF